MKSFAVMLCVLLATDYGFFSGAYTHMVWATTRDQLYDAGRYVEHRSAALIRT